MLGKGEHCLFLPLPYAMLCYVMLCYAMLCYAMLCYAMLCYVMLCYAMLCYVMLCYVMLCYDMLCYVMLCYVMLCYAMLCYVMLCYAMLCYAMLCYAMLCYAMLCYAMWLKCTLILMKGIFINFDFTMYKLQQCLYIVSQFQGTIIFGTQQHYVPPPNTHRDPFKGKEFYFHLLDNLDIRYPEFDDVDRS